MASAYHIVRGIWRRMPRWVRRIGEVPPLSLLRRRTALAMMRRARHQEIYDEAYYKHRSADSSAAVIARSVVADLRPRRVIDVGCGTGELLDRLREQGVAGVGLEYSDAALRICRGKGLDVRSFDLERDAGPDLRGFDLALSTEVAEHLPASCADRYVDLLCGAADVVAFTAATPGQGGTDHVNEQPHEYWLDKFAARGFDFDEALSQRWRTRWEEEGAQPWYHRNVMVVRRRSAARSP
jgi:SAM-dependent methyltransferase